LLEHERLHFFAEYAASRIEVLSHKSCYKEYFADAEAACHEEALANAHAIRVIGRRAPRRFREAAAAWMLTQPEGYRDFAQWLPPRFQEGRRRAACCMSRPKAVANILAIGSHPAEFVFFQVSSRACPVRIVLDAHAPWVRVGRPFPKQFGLQVYVFPNDHRPPHIHIDRPPGTPYTRYLWPDLTPFPSDRRLRSSEEKDLRRYVAVHGAAITKKVAAVQWQ
jgi:hypothetical protein